MSKLIVMCGLPGSGKTTKAKTLSEEYNATYISSDDLRKEMLGDENNQDNNESVFIEMNKRTADELRRGNNVIYDSCNISCKRRIALIQTMKRYNPEFICALVYKTYEDCLIDNRDRSRVVPDGVIKRMLMNFYFPQKFEGWNEIKIFFSKTQNFKTENDLMELFYGKNGICNIEHNNPHHSLTIGNHCIATYLNLLHDNVEDWKLNLAALLHDIGKPFCKVFIDSKGNPCDVAHYYQHHLVSAYMAVPYLMSCDTVISNDDLLEILALIDYHMHPYFWEKDDNEKMEKKYKRLWGDCLYDKIMNLHYADEKAH